MARPKLKRKRARPGVYIRSDDFPMDSFLKRCPLPAELSHWEPLLRGPVGQTLLTVLTTLIKEGFTPAQLEAAAGQVIEFYTQSYHRCTACHSWTDESMAGALILDGRFMITAICPKCAKLAKAGRATPAMERNMQEYVFGGER